MPARTVMLTQRAIVKARASGDTIVVIKMPELEELGVARIMMRTNGDELRFKLFGYAHMRVLRVIHHKGRKQTPLRYIRQVMEYTILLSIFKSRDTLELVLYQKPDPSKKKR